MFLDMISNVCTVETENFILHLVKTNDEVKKKPEMTSQQKVGKLQCGFTFILWMEIINVLLNLVLQLSCNTKKK